MDTPGGVLELVAHREREATWVGIARKDGELLGAVGLHTGSLDAQLETTSWAERGWGVAFGAVAPGIVRVEVRNDDGEAFPAAILALPEGFDPDYRAVWGLAERCRDRCEVVGFDEQGRPYDQTDPRLTGPTPSNDDRLNAIRAHADKTMRYYATAYLRESKENRHLIDLYMGIIANFLALLDRDGLDDRSMLSGRAKIRQQYIEQAKSDPWEPGTCSFCGEGPVAAWFEGPSFRTFVRSSAEVRAEEAWLACATCLALVEADDREGLAMRGTRRKGWANEQDEAITREMQDQLFWRHGDLR